MLKTFVAVVEKDVKASLSRANLKMKYNSTCQMKRTIGRHNVLVFRPTYSLRKKLDSDFS